LWLLLFFKGSEEAFSDIKNLENNVNSKSFSGLFKYKYSYLMKDTW